MAQCPHQCPHPARPNYLLTKHETKRFSTSLKCLKDSVVNTSFTTWLKVISCELLWITTNIILKPWLLLCLRPSPQMTGQLPTQMLWESRCGKSWYSEVMSNIFQCGGIVRVLWREKIRIWKTDRIEANQDWDVSSRHCKWVKIPQSWLNIQ